jgi:alkanesulfonate monooxygenase
VEKIGRYAEAGTERIYLQVLDLADLDHLELVAEKVMPQV